MGGLIAIAYFVTASRGSIGMTTETAAFITILAGALAYWEEQALAVALGVVTTALLSFKLELHRFAERISREDVIAMLKFAICLGPRFLARLCADFGDGRGISVAVVSCLCSGLLVENSDHYA